MSQHIVIQMPEQAQQLVLMFHGVGGSPEDLVPLGQIIAQQFPQTAVISIPGPDHSDFGRGFQWFSVSGVTEENRMSRIEPVMPLFAKTIQDVQAKTGCTAAQTVLLDFSQGAIMALESTQLVKETLCSQIYAMSGRFAIAPRIAPKETVIHFIHGTSDPIMPYQHTVQAAEHLQEIGTNVTTDLIPHLGHGVNQEAVAAVIKHLSAQVSH